HRIVLVSYGLLSTDLSRIKANLRKRYALVLDEVHYIKNDNAKRTRAAKAFTAAYRYGLSGTLIWDSPDDLWSLLDFLHPSIAGPRVAWEKRFCKKGLVRIKTRWG